MEHATLTTSQWTFTISDLRWETDPGAGWLRCGVRFSSRDDALRVAATMTLTAEDATALSRQLGEIGRRRVGTAGHSVAWESAEEDAQLTIHRDGTGALRAELTLDLAGAGALAQVEAPPASLSPDALDAFRSGLDSARARLS